MSKLKYFKVAAPYIHEDNTYSSLSDVVIKHEQEDPEIIKRAAIEIGYVINFFMDISTSAFNKTKSKYTQRHNKEDEVDYNDQMVNIFDGDFYSKKFHIDSEEILQVDYPHIKECIIILKEVSRVFRTDNISEKERERRGQYPTSYRYLLSKMLDGEFYFPEIKNT